MQRPLIGVTTKHGASEWVLANSQHYLDMLEKLGAQAVLLSPDAPALFPDGQQVVPDELGRLPRSLLAKLDGLILSGGGDVHPRYFGETIQGARNIDEKRDELELNLARWALAEDLPLFGICRGCQVLNVAAGGGMVQHLEGHSSTTQDPRFHGVTLDQGAYLRQVVGQAALQVNTYHHQGVSLENLAPLFRPAALAETDPWLVEAYESPTHRWVVGVQWHPERVFELESGHGRIWTDFFDKVTG